MTDFSGFDPRSLLTTTVKAKLDTKLPPIPLDETDEFLGLCSKVETRVITSKKDSSQYISLDTQWRIMDEAVAARMHIEQPTARYSFLLEVDPVKGLEVGPAKNVKLGRLLEACGIHSKEWSLSMLEGTTAWIKIKHRADDDDPEIIYNEVARVTSSPKRRAA
jgi:hypothetical protein